MMSVATLKLLLISKDSIQNDILNQRLRNDYRLSSSPLDEIYTPMKFPYCKKLDKLNQPSLAKQKPFLAIE